jgi:hypothetical protein
MNDNKEDKDLEKIRYFMSTWGNFFNYWKKKGVKPDPYVGTELQYPVKKKQESSTLPIQDFGTYDKAKQNEKIEESFSAFIKKQ